MSTRLMRWPALLGLFCALNASAVVRYVNVNSSTPLAPYTNWATAAQTIQTAVNASANGDLVLVTNGVYLTGGAFGPASSNRVLISKAITVQSVNGPAVTIIQGYQLPGVTYGSSAVRCAFLVPGATLSGFTLTNGATRGADVSSEYDKGGGGVSCMDSTATVSNCVIIGNTAYDGGGGAFSGTLVNCTIVSNTAYYGGGVCTVINSGTISNLTGSLTNCMVKNCLIAGNAATKGGGAYYVQAVNSAIYANAATTIGGGAYGCALTNCTVTGNSAINYGGGIYSTSVRNSIVYYNTAPYGPNYFLGPVNFCCVTPMPVTNGISNIAGEPLLTSPVHLSVGSPCRNAGSPLSTIGFDIDGEAWAANPSMGCDEYNVGAVNGPLTPGIQAAYTNVGTGFAVNFTGLIDGRTSGSRWDFGDGTMVSNEPYASHGWTNPGDYQVMLTAYNEDNPGGVTATLTVHVINAVHYVDLNGSNPLAPFNSWATAATNIQDAVDAASTIGATVLVTNGLYQTGGRVVYGAMTNRLAVTKPLLVTSVNGPAATVIQGYQVPGVTNGDSAVRCVYLTNGALLNGFTLNNGATRTNGDAVHEQSGGGAWSESVAASLTNCVLAGSSGYNAGGAYGGILNNCSISGNSAMLNGGGCDNSIANNCAIYGNYSASEAGGGYGSTLSNCLVSSNVSNLGGGGASSDFYNCVLKANSVSSYGGGAWFGTLNGCLITGNTAVSGGGIMASGLHSCTIVSNVAGNSAGGIINVPYMVNCILYYNSAPSSPDYGSFASPPVIYCCMTPITGLPTNNITNAPLFVNPGAGDFHLQAGSPCINAGNNSTVGSIIDLDSNPRIAGGTVDLGAYEFQSPTSLLSYAWAQQYGFATDGSADFLDPDHDGLNNYQEWRAGTDPTNPSSVLSLSSPTPSGTNLIITWQSVTNELYYLQRATNLTALPAFLPLATNLVGQSGTTSYTDTNAPAPGPYFYRVGVQ